MSPWGEEKKYQSKAEWERCCCNANFGGTEYQSKLKCRVQPCSKCKCSTSSILALNFLVVTIIDRASLEETSHWFGFDPTLLKQWDINRPNAEWFFGPIGSVASRPRTISDGPWCEDTLVRVSTGFRVVVQSNADSATVMSVILADDLLTMKLPQSCIVIAAGCHQVGTIGAECTVPDPSLMACKSGF